MNYGNGHQLVGLMFLNYNRKNRDGKVIDHINGHKDDNRLDNLEVVTSSENCIRFWESSNAAEVKKKMSVTRRKHWFERNSTSVPENAAGGGC